MFFSLYILFLLALTTLIQEAYRVRDCIYLVVNKFGKAYWSDIPSKSRYSKNIRG